MGNGKDAGGPGLYGGLGAMGGEGSGKKTGGKCPFGFDSPAKTEEEKPKGKCPFGFGSSSKSDGEIPFYDEEGGMHLLTKSETIF